MDDHMGHVPHHCLQSPHHGPWRCWAANDAKYGADIGCDLDRELLKLLIFPLYILGSDLLISVHFYRHHQLQLNHQRYTQRFYEAARLYDDYGFYSGSQQTVSPRNPCAVPDVVCKRCWAGS